MLEPAKIDLSVILSKPWDWPTAFLFIANTLFSFWSHPYPPNFYYFSIDTTNRNKSTISAVSNDRCPIIAI